MEVGEEITHLQSPRENQMLPRRLLLPGLLILLTSALTLNLRHGRAAVTLSTIPTWEETGAQDGGQYGYAVASAGDVNADGFEDVLVGAPLYSAGVTREGVAFAYYGTPEGLSAIPQWTASSNLSGARFGNAVSSAGDVNGDGYDDVIVGSYRYNNSHFEEGAAFLYFGSENGLVITPTWTIEGNQKEAQVGYSVASAGDVNGDGFADVIVGARWYTYEHSREGAVFVYYGSEDGLNTEADWSAYGGQVSAAFGYAVGGGGDVNGDGYDDVIIGAPLYDAGMEDEGAIYLYYGSPAGLSAAPAWGRLGDQPNASLGISVAIAADMNLDGYAEVIAGANRYSGDLPEEGAVSLFLGRASLPPAAPDWTRLGGQEYSGFGISVRGAGDVNADGFGDLLVGANRYSLDQPNEGAAFLYYGGLLGVNAYPAWKVYGNKADTSFGFSVASAGDVNGDGCDDVIVGAPDFRISTVIMGGAFQYSGKPSKLAQVFLPLIR
jgi:hypothetical protein